MRDNGEQTAKLSPETVWCHLMSRKGRQAGKGSNTTPNEQTLWQPCCSCSSSSIAHVTCNMFDVTPVAKVRTKARGRHVLTASGTPGWPWPWWQVVVCGTCCVSVFPPLFVCLSVKCSCFQSKVKRGSQTVPRVRQGPPHNQFCPIIGNNKLCHWVRKVYIYRYICVCAGVNDFIFEAACLPARVWIPTFIPFLIYHPFLLLPSLLFTVPGVYTVFREEEG